MNMHQFLLIRKNKWKCCMYCSRLFPFLNNKYLGGKQKVQQAMLELRRKHSKMILQQHFPSFYRQVFGKVDNMKSFLSNTSRQHFQKHRSCLYMLKILHESLKNWSPQRYSRMLRISRNPLLVIFQKFPLPI